ncbi:MAG: Mrp/NBP35 family ATP-binding protein [Bdellovibrionota bacterium]
MIINDEKIQEVKDFASRLLASHLASDVALNYPELQNKRIDSVEIKQQDLSLCILSDGLGLDKKIEIERVLRQKIASEFDLNSVSVRYKRKLKNPATEYGRGEAPADVSNYQSKPLGVSIDKKPIPGVKHVIVVASGKGGVGKSTVSTNIAAALAKKCHKIGLLDADIYGPSSPMMLGIDGSMGVLPSGKLAPVEAHGIKCASYGFLSDARHPVLWRGPMVAKGIKQFCYDVEWGTLDVLVVDLPPGTGDIQLALIENLPIHSAIVVSTPQDVALIDAHKAVSMFEKLDVPIAGLVENMSVHTCGQCGHQEHLFGEGGIDRFAEERSLAILGKIPLQRQIRESCDLGQPVALSSENPTEGIFSYIADAIVCHALV